GLAQRQTCQAMSVHAAAQITSFGLLAQQVVQTAADGLFVRVRLFPGPRKVGVAGAEQRKQSEGGSGNIVMMASRVAAVAFAVPGKAIERPVPIGGLVRGQPVQAGGDRGLGTGVAAKPP